MARHKVAAELRWVGQAVQECFKLVCGTVSGFDILPNVDTSAPNAPVAAGSGIDFEDRGTKKLKGVPGEWHLYAARLSDRARIG